MPWRRPLWAVLFLAALAAAPLLAALSPETGSFVFQNYSPKTYGANPQNWDIVQDSRGVMYFGNNDGVLEFDGVFWRQIRLTNGSAVRTLAIDARGRVYVGGRGEFGYLESDAHGTTQFVQIKVPKADADFFDVWNIVPTSSGVYFGTSYAVYFYADGGKLTVWRAKERFGRIFSAYGELFATTSDLGLRRYQNDEWVAGPTGDSALARGIALFASGEHPLIASVHKLFSFTLSDIVPFPNEAAEYLKKNEIYAVKQLSNGDIAVGTKNGGLVLLNRQGRLERFIRKQEGLPSDWITAIYEDRQHAIWLATDQGLVHFSPALSTFGEPQGLHGSVNAEARLGQSLFVATTTGAFRMRNMPGHEPAFEQIKGIHEQVFVLAEHGGDFFAGGEHGGLYRIVGDQAERLSKTDGVIYDIDIGYSRRDPNLFYTAGLGGVRQWRRQGHTWIPSEPAGLKGQEFLTVVQDIDGTLWSTTAVSVWHIDFSAETPQSKIFTAANGVPTGPINYAYLFHGHPVFATEKGLWRFSDKTGRFEPDNELGKEYADGSRTVSIVREDSFGNVWITGAGYHHYLQKDLSGAYRRFSSPMIQVTGATLWTIFLDEDGTCWASDVAGTLIRLERLDLKQNRSELPLLLRHISVIGQKDSLFDGDSAAPPITLQYRDNALRFEFAAPFYDAPAALEYQFQLSGDEKTWSPWTSETHKDYTNLFEGSYRFKVHVRDPHGIESADVVFPFRVLPPFYRTWWAYLTYVSVFLFAGWIILRWRLNALEAKNRWLEGVVEERTAEVRKERDQNEELLLNILPRPVASELRTNGSVKPTAFEDATVCFSDFVGFTLSSEKLSAETLITALNEYFTAFDEIIGRYGLEKLKTIGDAYMFAGGLPNRRPSHAVDAVLAALEMAAAVERLTKPEKDVNWKIRLGLYSGPVVSGVVGVRKFAFDIWGNTVNFAARMESAGQPGRVNLSETTYQRVERFIECEPRGEVPIKEGRRMEMYFAVNPRPELLQGPVVDGIPEAFRKAYEEAFGEAPKAFPQYIQSLTVAQ